MKTRTRATSIRRLKTAALALSLTGAAGCAWQGTRHGGDSRAGTPWDAGSGALYAPPPPVEKSAADKQGAGTQPPDGGLTALPGGMPLIETRPDYSAAAPPVDGLPGAPVRAFDPVFFERDSMDLDAAAKQRLREDADWLIANPGVAVTLGGYADRSQTLKFGLNLSMGRARSVQDYLAGQGLAPERLYPVGFGEAPEAADQNLMRRVELSGTVAGAGAARVPAESGGAPPVSAPASLPAGRDLL